MVRLRLRCRDAVANEVRRIAVRQLDRALSPKALRAREHALHDLTDLIGDDHDLALLRGLIGEKPDAYGGPDVVARIIGKIDRRRARLRRDAHVIGARCFADSSGRFVERLRGYWDASISTPA